MLHYSWDMVRDTCNYFWFWAIFCPFTPLTAQKINIKKKWKKHLEISSFYISFISFISFYQKLWSDDIQFLRYGARQTDGQTDGRMEKVTYRGGCPMQKRGWTLWWFHNRYKNFEQKLKLLWTVLSRNP